MTNNFVLLPNRGMSLAIFIAFGPELFRVVAPFDRFTIIIMRIGLPAFVHQIFGKVQIAFLTGFVVEPHQG